MNQNKMTTYLSVNAMKNIFADKDKIRKLTRISLEVLGDYFVYLMGSTWIMFSGSTFGLFIYADLALRMSDDKVEQFINQLVRQFFWELIGGCFSLSLIFVTSVFVFGGLFGLVEVLKLKLSKTNQLQETSFEH